MIKTEIVKAKNKIISKKDLQKAVKILKNGGLVAFPTETVYGIGADALNVNAVKKIFDAKGRPSDNPLIVHVASINMAKKYCYKLTKKAQQLAQKFWPGPLTLILKRKKCVPNIVTAGLDTVALRIPNHHTTLKLISKFKGGIVGPSANISGKPSPTIAKHVLHDLNGKIDLIIDAGSTKIGVESTVLDLTEEIPVLLRTGGVSKEEIEKVVGKIKTTQKNQLLKKSPGTRHKHYAPNAKVILFPKNDYIKLSKLINQHKRKKIGMIINSQNFNILNVLHYKIKIKNNVKDVAKNIFRALRTLDEKKVDIILVESVEQKGIGIAVMDRLKRAASAK